MSLHDILNTHIFPARPLPSERRPTFDRTGGESTVTTVVDPGLVARCIIAANPVDEPDPSITFIASDLPLSSLSSLLDELIPQGAVPPPAFLNGLHYSSTLIRRDVPIDEVQQYALVSAVYFTLTSVLMDTPEIFNDGILPPASSWEMSSTPEVGTDGQLDFEIRGISPTGLACRRGIGWEYKREIVLLLRYLQTFWAATSTPQGVVMNLDESGLPTLVFPPGMHGHDHITKWCNQVGVLLRHLPVC